MQDEALSRYNQLLANLKENKEAAKERNDTRAARFQERRGRTEKIRERRPARTTPYEGAAITESMMG